MHLRALVGPKVYVFVLWSEARHRERAILADLEATFRILDKVEVVWSTGDTFARNLTRMYGDALPPGSDKERHCGTGPFLAVIVEDPAPKFRVRRTNRGYKVLNSTVFDARSRYRSITGGGYRVHASDSITETEQNLVLIFGEGSSAFLGRRGAAPVRRHQADPVGTAGWDSLAQLIRVLKAYGATRIRHVPGAHRLVVWTSDAWWAEHLAGGEELGPMRRSVDVDGARWELVLREQRSRGTTLKLGWRRLRLALR